MGRSDQRKALGELDLEAALRSGLASAPTEETRATRCDGCGALVEFTGAEHAKECPFCATPVVIGTGTSRQIKPQAVIPFRLDESQARTAMTRWMGNLWFAPGSLLEYARKGRPMAGIYTPYWTFDAQTRSRYAGQRGTYYYETRTVTVNVNGRNEQRQEQIRKVRWQGVRGWVQRAFDDVTVLGSTSLPRGYTEALAPWDLTALTGYAPEYLSGFAAEGYTVPLDQAHDRARQVMADQIHRDVLRDIGGDEQRVEQINTDWSAETFKHVLLPVWLAAYKYNGRTYRFVVNGQTGKVQGERPWSAWKIAFAVLLAIIVIGAVAVLSQNQ